MKTSILTITALTFGCLSLTAYADKESYSLIENQLLKLQEEAITTIGRVDTLEDCNNVNQVMTSSGTCRDVDHSIGTVWAAEAATADYVEQAKTATTAEDAETADHAAHAATAVLANKADAAAYASTAQTSINAAQATYATLANKATHANKADTATHADKANTADKTGYSDTTDQDYRLKTSGTAKTVSCGSDSNIGGSSGIFFKPGVTEKCWYKMKNYTSLHIEDLVLAITYKGKTTYVGGIMNNADCSNSANNTTCKATYYNGWVMVDLKVEKAPLTICRTTGGGGHSGDNGGTYEERRREEQKTVCETYESSYTPKYSIKIYYDRVTGVIPD